MTIKSRIGDKTVDEDPQVLLNLVWFDVEFLFVFGCHFLDDLFHDLFGDVVNMGATFGRTYRVHKRNLLEGSITQTADDLPPITFFLSDLRQLLVLFILQVKINVLFEVSDRYFLVV